MYRTTTTRNLILALLLLIPLPAIKADVPFQPQEIAKDLGVGYAVRLLDLNADGRRDIVVVDKTRVVWFENPDWTRHTLLEGQTKPDNVCFAPYDIDGDGDLDLALGAGWAGQEGSIGWLECPSQASRPWTLHSIGSEPFVHRMRWADADGSGKDELIVVPLVGAGGSFRNPDVAPIRVLAYSIPEDPRKDPWPLKVISDKLHVAHNFWPTDLDDDGTRDLLVVSYEGITWLRRQRDGSFRHTLIGAGHQEASSARRGASEIQAGTRAGNGKYFATIEPWHGHQVVVYSPPKAAGTDTLWHRNVIDEDLKWGHAVWCVNIDQDEDQELIVGVRDNRPGGLPSGVRIYDPVDEQTWRRQLVDPGGVAVEDLAVADLNGDDRPDIVAVGRASKNVRIYWNAGEVNAE